MTDAPRYLRVIEGCEPGAERHRTLWRCDHCARAGRASRGAIEIVAEMYVEGGVIEPGPKRLACLTCFAAGIVTLI